MFALLASLFSAMANRSGPSLTRTQSKTPAGTAATLLDSKIPSAASQVLPNTVMAGRQSVASRTGTSFLGSSSLFGTPTLLKSTLFPV